MQESSRINFLSPVRGKNDQTSICRDRHIREGPLKRFRHVIAKAIPQQRNCAPAWITDFNPVGYIAVTVFKGDRIGRDNLLKPQRRRLSVNCHSNGLLENLTFIGSNQCIACWIIRGQCNRSESGDVCDEAISVVNECSVHISNLPRECRFLSLIQIGHRGSKLDNPCFRKRLAQNFDLLEANVPRSKRAAGAFFVFKSHTHIACNIGAPQIE